MSQLREQLTAAWRRRPGSIGFAFGARREEAVRPLLVLAATGPDNAQSALDGGVDGLLLHAAPAAAEAVTSAAGKRPVGLALEDATADGAEEAKRAGVNFLLIDPQRALATALQVEGLGAVMRVDVNAGEQELLAVRTAGFEALLVEAPAAPLTVATQLALRRVFMLTTTPLIVETAEVVDASTLRAWRDAGAHGVLARDGAVARVGELLSAAAEVPPLRERQERESPSLGALGGAFGEEAAH